MLARFPRLVSLSESSSESLSEWGIVVGILTVDFLSHRISYKAQVPFVALSKDTENLLSMAIPVSFFAYPRTFSEISIMFVVSCFI
jgi:hypothetical protein